MKPLEFNTVFVIECLRSIDKKTGTDLFKDTIRRQLIYKKMDDKCHLFSIKTKKEFFESLEHIKQHIIYNFVSPIIHIEMHGSPEGLESGEGELIEWKELRNILIEMNLVCENNLFLTLATCYGAYIFKTISPKFSTPFWGFVGAFEEVNVGEVLANFNAFYSEFLNSFDFNLAESALNQSNPTLISKFKFRNTQQVFDQAYSNYEAKYLTPQMVEHRTILISAQLRPLLDFKHLSIEQIKDLAKTQILDNNLKHKENLMSRFFLWNFFPHHKPKDN